jgi:hypothetical protein
VAAVALAAGLEASPQARKLRVGVVADARSQPRWVIEAFDRVARSDFAEIVVISTRNSRVSQPPWLWQLYARADRALFGAEPAEPRDISEVLHGHYLPAEGGADLLKYDLDVLFVLDDLDETALHGVARYGVWRFFFDEVAEGAALTGSGVVVRLSAGAPARLAYQSWSRTHRFSLERNRAQLLRKTAEFAWRTLRELHRSGSGWLEQCKLAHEAGASQTAPTNSEVIRNLPAIGGRMLHRALEKVLCVEQWFLAWRWREARVGDARAVPDDLAGYTRLMPPRDRLWAHPFPIEKNGRYFVFFEERSLASRKGHIAMIELERSGRHSPPVRVLERDYSLSYPFLVEQDGELYLVPQTAQKGTVELYRCVDFPRRWKLERTLVDGVRLADATFHRGPDRWWMFATAAARGSSVFDDELHLFHAENLLFGPWRAHPRNPVKSDARGARPAGRLFWRNGALYRPAQICVPRHGAGLAINRVVRLTPQDYAERQVERILPAARHGLLGLHTLNRAGDLTVVDAFTRRTRI